MQQEMGVASEIAIQPVPTWAQVDQPVRGSLEWRTVDTALRTISARRSALDAEEARWLRLAEELQIWRPLGMVSALDYMERVLGYAPRTAKERLRVARALGGLASLETALARSELPYSAVRELTRVATPDTEDAWLDAARDKSLRQIEDLVADRKPGDRPCDPKNPAARVHVVRLELSAETFALFRQARQALDDEHGTSLSEDQLIAALCSAALDGASSAEATGRAKYQVAVTVCERCQQGWQEGAGAKVAISPAAVERALCDANHIGSIDDETPARAYQDVAPSVSRLVWHRDAGRCRVPGCRSSRGLEIHHIVHRADGGGHHASNVVLLCSACHHSHHAGTLAITGTAEHLDVRRPARGAGAPVAEAPIEHAGPRRSSDLGRGRAHVGTAVAAPAREEVGGSAIACGEAALARLREQATQALIQSGYKHAVAREAVDEACRAGIPTSLEGLVFEAYRRCPRRSTLPG